MPIEKGKVYERAASLKKDGDDLYSASVSSEAPVRQFFGTEILEHTKDAINLERAENGLSLLFDHRTDKPIGRATNFRLDSDKRLRADFRFSENSELARQIKAEVDDGILGDVSIRYSIDEYKDEGDETFRITRWTPSEASIVTVPADHSVGIGRSNKPQTESNPMPDERKPQGGNGGGDVVDIENARNLGAAEGARLERQRIADIEAVFDLVPADRMTDELRALRNESRSQNVTVDAVREKVLAVTLAQGDGPAGPPGGGETRQHVEAGDDELDKFQTGAIRALEARAGLLSADEHRTVRGENEFVGLTLSELARESLLRQGVSLRGLDRFGIVAAAFRGRTDGRRDLIGHMTGHFPAILEDVANKSLLRGYTEAPETWATWVRQTDLADFKPASRSGLSEFSHLDEVIEGGEYKHGTVTDRKESIQGAKFGKLLSITRETIINDDLSALSTLPAKVGRAASRKVGDKVYALLTSPPVMNQDGKTVFHADHNNSGTAGAPSVTTLDEARKLMALQTDPADKANALNIRASFFIVPVGLMTTADILMSSEHDPVGNAGAKGGARQPNPFRSSYQVIADARLDKNSATEWYMAADANVFDTIEVGFVGGRREPSLESREGWTVDGVEWKVRHEFGVAVLEYRTLFKNAGA